MKKGEVVHDSVIFEGCVVEEDARVDLAICDKWEYIGRGSVVGYGDTKEIPNQEFPSHLYAGIILVGKKEAVPEGMKIGRICIVNTEYNGGEGLSTENLEDDGIL